MTGSGNTVIAFSGDGVRKAPKATTVTGNRAVAGDDQRSCNACWNSFTHATIRHSSIVRIDAGMNSLAPSQILPNLFLNRRNSVTKQFEEGGVIFPLGKALHSSFKLASGSGEPTPGAVGKGPFD